MSTKDLDLAKQIARAPGVWRRGASGNPAAIEALRVSAPIELPKLYLEFLAITNGGEGDLGVPPGWFAPWAAEHVMEHNVAYEVAESLPGLFGFGSNGGGELLAFDARGEKPWPILMVPFIPMQIEEAVRIATDFEAFSAFIGVPSSGVRWTSIGFRPLCGVNNWMVSV